MVSDIGDDYFPITAFPECFIPHSGEAFSLHANKNIKTSPVKTSCRRQTSLTKEFPHTHTVYNTKPANPANIVNTPCLFWKRRRRRRGSSPTSSFPEREASVSCVFCHHINSVRLEHSWEWNAEIRFLNRFNIWDIKNSSSAKSSSVQRSGRRRRGPGWHSSHSRADGFRRQLPWKQRWLAGASPSY